MPSFSDCHGCSLCLLSCPMWLQWRDIRFSPQGYAKAVQHGADIPEMREALSACIQCGACDLLCPEKIDLTGMIAAIWQEAGLTDVSHTSVPDSFPLSCDPAVQQNLGPDDFYVIDARTFHTRHAERVRHYDALRHATGCSMNLDLHRMAIPTGIGSLSDSLGQFDTGKQIEWLIQGRRFNRVIVENRADKTMLAEITGKPVIHVSELVGS
ncbi:MAG: 4Fe-4S dicluster domain-containing protein [Mariprofundaceae bacterium]|nr:4Fe-4S dicluster domain-containing protein [Mariprofundaceae bacterium]